MPQARHQRPLGLRRPGEEGKQQAKREACRAKSSEPFIEKHAERTADREAEVRDHALDAVDEAITRFRADLGATRPVRQAEGTIAEESRMIGPRDLAVLVDRLQVLLDRPSTISEGRGLTITPEALPIDALQAIIERTRGLAEPDPKASPIPRSPRGLDD